MEYEKLLKLGDIAFSEDNLIEAYDYYKRSIETADEDIYEAILKKGYTAILLSDEANFRAKELLGAIKRSLDYDTEIIKEYLIKLLDYCKDFHDERINEFYAVSKTGLMCKKDLFLFDNADKASFLTLESARYGIEFAEKINDIDLKKKSMKLACDALHFICIDFQYYEDTSFEKHIFAGRSYPDKKKYIEEYDEIVYFLREDEPDFRREDENPINRIAPQKEEENYEGQRERVLRAIQRYKDNDLKFRRNEEKRAAEMASKMKYYETHPEEYKKYLEEIENLKALHKKFIEKLKAYDDLIDDSYDQREIIAMNAKALFGEKVKIRKQAEQRLADINYLLATEYSDWSEFRDL